MFNLLQNLLNPSRVFFYIHTKTPGQPKKGGGSLQPSDQIHYCLQLFHNNFQFGKFCKGFMPISEIKLRVVFSEINAPESNITNKTTTKKLFLPQTMFESRYYVKVFPRKTMQLEITRICFFYILFDRTSFLHRILCGLVHRKKFYCFL